MIKTDLKTATSIKEINRLEAQLRATRCFSGRWDWITWQICDEPGCYKTEAYQGNGYPDPNNWNYCDNMDCDMVKPVGKNFDGRSIDGRSAICRDCFATNFPNFGKNYLCRKCLRIEDKSAMELETPTPQISIPNPGYPVLREK